MSGDNKTEKPTPKRRNEARKKGQVARSTDINSAAVLLVGFATLAITAPAMWEGTSTIVREGLARTADPSIVSQGGMADLTSWGLRAMVPLVAPVAAAAVFAGVTASVLQVRPKLTFETVKPQFSRIDPRAGFKRLFSMSSVFEAGKAIAKTAVVAIAAWMVIWPRLTSLASLTGAPPATLLTQLGAIVLRMAFSVSIAFAVLALVDYAWQRRRFEKSLRMSKEEVKQEARQQDVAPEVRGAIRRRQFQQARRRMLAEVATADVVITNPTHFAVALRYDGTKPAPELVAKGQDLVAQAIRQAAQEHGVPVLSNPPLARALHSEVELGQTIPEAFFAAVAEVLAFVFRTSRRSQLGRRAIRAAA
jgi:flagellar biosynthetic protein FlhB